MYVQRAGHNYYFVCYYTAMAQRTSKYESSQQFRGASEGLDSYIAY